LASILCNCFKNTDPIRQKYYYLRFVLIREFVRRVKGSDPVPIVLVGNKSDLAHRVISTAQGAEFAKQRAISFFETSAKERINVDEVFHEITRQVVARKQVEHSK
jgi:GTPase SAR1 family protein